ncbi:MAG: DUF4166 domain-containing protein [Pseudomonadales bacterium]|nr:DUF4166 domain-containing protein [Pseudomonadales bacterium]
MNILAQQMDGGFERLKPLLQAVHTGSQRIEGFAQIKRGNAIARLICNIFGFPAEHKNCPLTVDCEHSADAMLWHRNFNGLKMQSHFKSKGNYLVECLGPLQLYLQPREEDGQLNYHFVSTHFMFIPLPGFLSPSIEAWEKELEGKYHFNVCVKMPFIGEVIAYKGIMQRVESNADEGQTL